MKSFTNELINRLNELYIIYEGYCWKCDDRKINILFQDNCIALYLNCGNDNVDEFILSFNNRENKLYQYVALKFFDMVLGDVFIYKECNQFYNKKHKSYVMITVGDEKLLTFINQLVFNQEEVYIHEEINNFFKVKPLKLCNAKFFDTLDERIDVSKKLLRG